MTEIARLMTVVEEPVVIAEKTCGDWLFGAVIRPLGPDLHAP